MPSLHHKLLGKFLDLFFKLLYHQLAWSYDLVANIVSLGQWYNWVTAALPELPGHLILELGHGTGHLQIALARSGQTAFGLDVSPQMGQLAKRSLMQNGFSPHLTNGAAQKLPYPTNTFTHIIATFPTEYIIAPETIAEVYRTLKPGGQLIIIPVAWITGSGLLHKAAALLFKITGQAEDLTDEQLAVNTARIEKYGFNVNHEIRQMEKSRLLILKATKPG